jgi:tetratricopeptide (TPR) repeat protein
MKKSLVFLFVGLGFFCVAQTSKIDSMVKALDGLKEDTNKVNALNTITKEYNYLGSPTIAINYGNVALQLSEKLNYKKGASLANSLLGTSYTNLSQYPKALGYYLEALKIDEETGNKRGVGLRLNKIGMVYERQREPDKALNYYFRAIKIGEEIGDSLGIGDRLSNIGNVYMKQGIESSDQKTRNLLFEKALSYYLHSLAMQSRAPGAREIQTTLGNIANVYLFKSEYDKAKEYYEKALRMSEQAGDKNSMARQYANMGELYSMQKKFPQAEQCVLKAMEICSQIGSIDYRRQFEATLSGVYENWGKHALALQHYKNSMRLKDSIFNAEKAKELTRKEMNYEFEKKEAAIKAEQDRKDAIAEAELRQQQKQLNYLVAGFIIVIVLALFIYRGYRQKRLANIIIEEKNREIMDSIIYAKRIQTTLITSEKYIERTLERLKRKHFSDRQSHG